MEIHHSGDSTPSAPNPSSRCTIGTNIDSGYGSSTKLGDTVAGTDSSSQECVLERPDPGHSDMLHTTNTQHVQSAVKKFQWNPCPSKFTNAHNLRSHLLLHGGERPFVCTICGKTFAHQHERKRHEGLHSSENNLVCIGELSAQDLALISAWRNAPTGKRSLTYKDSLTSNDSGYESALHLDSSEPHFNSPVQVEAQTEGPQKALSYYGSLSSLGSQFMPSPPLQNLQDPTDILTLLSDRPETSEDYDNSLEKTIPSGDEPDCEGFSRRIELSGHHIDSQGTSECEEQSSCKVRHVSKETTFAQERVWEKDGNGQIIPKGHSHPTRALAILAPRMEIMKLTRDPFSTAFKER